ncbi:hypothetical protein EOL94_04375 [bacterium]|nr:hypothetical protein [Patescibacteria group bacterium]MDD3939770.1 hypothetical protein [Patescibacteria group bacterium]NCD01301.1 hypothetical protein [bacterium]
MKQTEITKKLNNLLIFDKKSLKILENRNSALDANIKYWLKNKNLIALKNGVYIIREKYEKEKDKNSYLEYLANQLLKPSYLSLEYVLSKYQILSEPVNAITSITTKQSRLFINELNAWRYYSLPSALFTGYKTKSFAGQPVLEASKAKALFDFFYLRLKRNNNINISNLRLNLENMKPSDWKEFFCYFKNKKSTKWNNLRQELKQYAKKSTPRIS